MTVLSIRYKNTMHEVLVDEEDLPELRRWSLSVKQHRHTHYIRCELRGSKPRVRTYLHRLVLGVEDERRIDHADGNGSNCQKANLRLATQSENQRNRAVHTASYTRPYKNVKRLGPASFEAYVTVNKKYKSLGHFAAAEEAARAYDTFAIENFGEFALPNFEYAADGSVTRVHPRHKIGIQRDIWFLQTPGWRAVTLPQSSGHMVLKQDLFGPIEIYVPSPGEPSC